MPPHYRLALLDGFQHGLLLQAPGDGPALAWLARDPGTLTRVRPTPRGIQLSVGAGHVTVPCRALAEFDRMPQPWMDSFAAMTGMRATTPSAALAALAAALPAVLERHHGTRLRLLSGPGPDTLSLRALAPVAAD